MSCCIFIYFLAGLCCNSSYPPLKWNQGTPGYAVVDLCSYVFLNISLFSDGLTSSAFSTKVHQLASTTAHATRFLVVLTAMAHGHETVDVRVTHCPEKSLLASSKKVTATWLDQHDTLRKNCSFKCFGIQKLTLLNWEVVLFSGYRWCQLPTFYFYLKKELFILNVFILFICFSLSILKMAQIEPKSIEKVCKK